MSNTLRSLVLNVHNALISFEQSVIQNQVPSVSINSITQYACKKSLEAWPLKRGSVVAHYEPWNAYSTSLDCVRLCLAFVIKCFFVFHEHHAKRDVVLLKHMFQHDFFHVVFWRSIQESKDEFFFSKHYFKPATPVILCLEDIVFQTRQTSNTDLVLFESFIEHLARGGNGLVVFSQQNLISSKNALSQMSSAGAEFSYSATDLKKFVKKNLEISIEDALEPVVFLKNSLPDHMQEIFDTGAFDRLLELLTIGQDFIFSIEKAFEEKIKTI